MTDRAYGRISLDTERSSSIAKQRERLRKFVLGDDGNPDHVAWYEDRSVSGSKVAFPDRPEGARLLRELRPGDRVLVTKIDRASRNVRDLLDLVERIKGAGASIVFVDDKINTEGPMGEFILTILAAIAQLEASMIGERRRQSLEVMKNEGRHAVGSAPYGFMTANNPDGRGLVLRPDPVVGPLVRDAVLRVIQGENYAVAKAGLDLSMSGFKHLLHNPRLAGMTPDHQYEVYTNAQGNEQYKVKASGVLTYEDGTPRIDPDAALLTLGEWLQLQEMLESRKGKAWETAAGYGAALRCGVCGHRLYRAQSNSAPQGKYQCLREKHEPGQPGVAISTRLADEYIERTFLAEHGSREHVVSRVVEDSAERLEAISRAKVALMSAEAVLRTADEDHEDSAYIAVKAAKRAVRDAEARPSARRIEWVSTGKTVAQVWEQSDYPERCAMLRAVATWRVLPGRAPVAERISLDPVSADGLVSHAGGEVTVQIPLG